MQPHQSAGHLSLDLEKAPRDNAPFSFDRTPRRLSLSVATSLAIDALIVALLIVMSRSAKPTAQEGIDTPSKSLVWLVAPGPGGGGGGGGNRMKAPPRQAERPGKDALTVPVKKPLVLEQQTASNEPNPTPQLTIPARELSAAVEALPGALEAPPGPPTVSTGSGSGGGAGTGSGTGIGSGAGSGLGPGTGGGTGGGVYRPGSGVTNPILLHEVKPAYTSDAVRARIQGSVFLECVIKADGSVGEVRVIRSLDAMFGLDLEAIKAARQWRFRPSVRMGEPVPVWVTLQLDFVLH